MATENAISAWIPVADSSSTLAGPSAIASVDSDADCSALPSDLSPMLAEYACTAYNKCMQYTIRGVPAAVDHALRERARVAGKSLNETAVDALTEGSGMTGSRRKRRDLADIAQTWKADKAVEAALADQDRVDEDLWR